MTDSRSILGHTSSTRRVTLSHRRRVRLTLLKLFANRTTWTVILCVASLYWNSKLFSFGSAWKQDTRAISPSLAAYSSNETRMNQLHQREGPDVTEPTANNHSSPLLPSLLQAHSLIGIACTLAGLIALLIPSSSRQSSLLKRSSTSSSPIRSKRRFATAPSPAVTAAAKKGLMLTFVIQQSLDTFMSVVTWIACIFLLFSQAAQSFFCEALVSDAAAESHQQARLTSSLLSIPGGTGHHNLTVAGVVGSSSLTERAMQQLEARLGTSTQLCIRTLTHQVVPLALGLLVLYACARVALLSAAMGCYRDIKQEAADVGKRRRRSSAREQQRVTLELEHLRRSEEGMVKEGLIFDEEDDEEEEQKHSSSRSYSPPSPLLPRSYNNHHNEEKTESRKSSSSGSTSPTHSPPPYPYPFHSRSGWSSPFVYPLYMPPSPERALAPMLEVDEEEGGKVSGGAVS